MDIRHNAPRLTAEELARRFHQIDAQIAEVEAIPAATLSEADRRARSAALASLHRARRWYLGRLRAKRPVETVGVATHDQIRTREAAG